MDNLAIGVLGLVLTALLLAAIYIVLLQRRALRRLNFLVEHQLSAQAALPDMVAVLHERLGLELGTLPPADAHTAGPDFLIRIVDHLLTAKPQIVVECGSGTTTCVIARCLEINGTGKFYSLEHHPTYAQATRNFLESRNLSTFASVIDAPLQTYSIGDTDHQWYATDQIPEGKIDLLIVDGPPFVEGTLARYPVAPLLFDRLAEEAVVFIDDADRASEQAMLRRIEGEFPNLQRRRVSTQRGCVTLRWRS